MVFDKSHTLKFSKGRSCKKKKQTIFVENKIDVSEELFDMTDVVHEAGGYLKTCLI